LRALADFIKSNSGGWWFRVPVLAKTGEETAPAPSDKYLLCLESPLGLSTETLVEGLICSNFLTLTKNECMGYKGVWVDFGAHYMLGNLLEITTSTLLRSEGRQRHHYVKWDALMTTTVFRNASQRRRLTPTLGSHVGLGAGDDKLVATVSKEVESSCIL
jgi:hypothetical protein